MQRLLFVLLISVFATNIAMADHIVWRKQPIKITLPVGQERLISFPQAVSLGYNPSRLPSSLLRVQNDNKTLYLLAKQPFENQRMQAKLQNGQILLLDIEAKQSHVHSPIDISLPKILPEARFKAKSPNKIDMVRFAIQQLYTPKRLLSNPFHLTRFPMEADHTIPLVYDASLTAMPLASWRGATLYVTAVLLKNQLASTLSLNPKNFCGHWQAVSFYPLTRLLPHGGKPLSDTSTAFFLSTRPFAATTGDCFAGEN